MTFHFENYFNSNASLLGEVLFYHLNLEALLTEVIRRDENGPGESKLRKLTFAGKVSECLRLSRISQELHDCVIALNRVRNQYAHELGYEISFDEALDLARKCGEAGVEFSDSVDRCTLEQAKNLDYDTLSLLNATFRNTFFTVAYDQGDEPLLEFIS
ncbi:MAG: hypothetical protein ACTHNO_06105 [Ralstonia sp.]|uniref:hypothetical protein n=1 Tax=Ralstonia sp. TaxID=54061 RepID=UPI003F7E496E